MTKEPSTLKFMSVDVSLTCTGFSAFDFNYDLSSRNFSFLLRSIGVIQTDAGDDLDSRIRYLLSEVKSICDRLDISSLFIEEPPQAIYKPKGFQKKHFGGRASAIFPLFAACYSIVGYGFAEGKFCRVIKPQTWQASEKPKDCHMESKEWSLMQANMLLKYLQFPYRELKTKKDANIADSLNMGIFCIKKMQSDKWHIPFSK